MFALIKNMIVQNMNNKHLISIIIPCYNVERYIEQCVRSIMGQSYKNLEIIAVDDGSPDNSPQILDKLANADCRIKVLHKQNEGVSAARNSGLDVATGDYVVFVDGDDYLAPDYVDYMFKLACRYDSDFVMSQNCYTQKNEPQYFEDRIKKMSPSEATALLISPRVIVGCWNKMFKREFINKFTLSFSTTLFYGEGLTFITKASQLANSVTVGNRKVYYYRRNNETSATSKFNIQKYYNGEKALDNIHKELIVKDANVELMMALHKSMFCLGALSQAYAHNLQKDYKTDCKHWRAIIKKNLRVLCLSNKVSLYRKGLLMLGFLFPELISKMDMCRRAKIASKSVI